MEKRPLSKLTIESSTVTVAPFSMKSLERQVPLESMISVPCLTVSPLPVVSVTFVVLLDLIQKVPVPYFSMELKVVPAATVSSVVLRTKLPSPTKRSAVLPMVLLMPP